MQNANFYFSVNLLDYYMMPRRLTHRKLGDPHLRGLVVSFALRDTGSNKNAPASVVTGRT